MGTGSSEAGGSSAPKGAGRTDTGVRGAQPPAEAKQRRVGCSGAFTREFSIVSPNYDPDYGREAEITSDSFLRITAAASGVLSA